MGRFNPFGSILIRLSEAKVMKIPHRTPLLFLLLQLQASIFFNSLSIVSSLNHSSSNDDNNAHLFQDVLKELAAKQKWDLEGIKILEFDVESVRFGFAESYEIRLGLGKTRLLAKFSDEVSSWKKPSYANETSFGSLINGIGSVAVIRSFKIVGPFDLMVEGDAHLSILLPNNATHAGLKRILVGEGITVEVSDAEEVSVFYSSNLSRLLNETRTSNGKVRTYPFRLPFCSPLLPLRVLGSATLSAYRTQNPNDYIRSSFLSKDSIELLPDKCFSRNTHTENSPLLDSLKPQFNMLESVFQRYLSNWILQNGLLAFVKVKMRASVVVQFQLELENTFGTNSSRYARLAEWRTKPTVERASFEVLARLDALRLKPLVIKKLKPLIVADSTEWRNLLPNISFTKFPSLLVPPEALTLDVKW
ncbi:uncharacterized protein LOC120086963 [Benincasa hispida]|uniref:uncharacterized protein LOC120086963 n=1 Tax=Benincasa hispida TaxID=102211 RepID=UPI001901D9C2|nr:uncharacterized protein LOC120086963 [Benincasa hispida]XP_038899719.1 uncharacterized protein LOC120086963 [Benincasa hispida]XP_038899720.1 uncharacterized protein LOC120086963 [Benincasa hispida]